MTRRDVQPDMGRDPYLLQRGQAAGTDDCYAPWRKTRAFMRLFRHVKKTSRLICITYQPEQRREYPCGLFLKRTGDPRWISRYRWRLRIFKKEWA